MINAMTCKGYTTSMVFDVEDKIIVGRVLDIDDIMAFHLRYMLLRSRRRPAAVSA